MKFKISFYIPTSFFLQNFKYNIRNNHHITIIIVYNNNTMA